MKILVTGASGFVGSHLCERLEQKGHQVFALARNLEKLKHFAVPGIVVQGELHWERRHTWLQELPDDLDAVIHTAGVVHSFSDEEFLNTNARATELLITDLAEKYSELKFVLISSLAASGPTENGIDRHEEHRPRPTSAYGRSKLLAEEVLFKRAPQRWTKTIIRPPMVIGPRDPAILDIVKMVNKGIAIAPGMNGMKKIYSYVCVFDLVEVIVRAVESTTISGTFFASHEQKITMKELIKTIQKKLGRKRTLRLKVPFPLIKMAAHSLAAVAKVRPMTARLTPDKLHELEPISWTCTSGRSRQELGAQYNWSLEDTVEATLEDYRERGWL
jgi:nucleoside-diphosphate-sugar epimerase